MNSKQKIEYLRVMTESDDPAEVLHLYLDVAGRKIISQAYPFEKDTGALEVPPEYHFLQIEIAAYLMNKRGAEGQLGHEENGINRVYADADVPKSMLHQIIPKVGVIM